MHKSYYKTIVRKLEATRLISNIMKKCIFILIFLNIFQINAQELTILETLDYINLKLKGGRKIELQDGGKLKILDLRPDYWFTDSGIDFTRTNNRNDNYYKMIPYKSDEVSIYEINIINNDYTENRYTYGNFLTELVCKNNKMGCIKSKFYAAKEIVFKADVTNTIKVSSSDRETNEKLFNSIRYLISLAKNNIKYQNIDNDPFASQNFNSLEVVSENDNENIKLTKDNGIFKINVKFGTIDKAFILDSGASEISISQNLESELIANGYLKKEDYIESGLFKIADGSIITCRRINIKQLKVGSFVLKNVNASIGGPSSPLLLGKSFLDKFKKWSIDNNSQTLSLEK